MANPLRPALALRATHHDDSDEASLTEPMIMGVCSALSDRYGFSVLAVRAAFVVLGVAGGFGVLAYATCALFGRTQLKPSAGNPTPVGTSSSAQFDGATPTARRFRRVQPRVSADLGLFAASLGLLWELQRWWPGYRVELVVPVALVALGLVIGWQGVDLDTSAGQARPGPDGSGQDRSRQMSASRKFGAIFLRIAAGSVLIFAAMVTIAGQSVDVSTLVDSSLAVLVAIAGLAIVAAPPLLRFASGMNREREQRIRQQERADLAAHLHDSVLQTLTLIQKRSDNPSSVSSLARRQERELRRWLYTGMTGAVGDNAHLRFGQRLQATVDEIEDHYEITVEAVIIGDTEVNDATRAILAASREALVNAGKFSQCKKISLFAEVSPDGLSVFVRDRGKGFDLSAVPEDRRGISESISRRMRKVGGTAEILTMPGDGCEVALHLGSRHFSTAANDQSELATP